MYFNNKLVFICPPSFATTWATTQISDMFDASGNLVLRIDSSDYTYVTEGEESNWSDRFSSTAIALSSRRTGFNVNVRNTKEEIYLALLELSRNCLSSDLTRFTPLVVHDYVKVTDWTGYQQGYTVRTGKIVSFDNLTGTISKGRLTCEGVETPDVSRSRLGSGFSFKFLSQGKSEIW